METMTKYEGGNVQTVSSEIGQSREMAEVQAAVVMARRFPRDEKAAIDRIKNACCRQGLAESAVYQYARAGTDISGPSIRLAEAIAQNWGNLQYGVREIDQRNGESTCEAFAWDVETNTRVVKVFKVAHIRHTKRGDTTLTDPRDIYELVANQGARRVRACILGVVPGDVAEDAVRQCEVTLKATADTSPEGLKKVLKAFANMGVTKKQIEARIQRNFDAITPAQILALRKIAVSIKDGMSTTADWFADEGAAEAKLSLADAVKAKAAEVVAPPDTQSDTQPDTPPETPPKMPQDGAEDDIPY